MEVEFDTRLDNNDFLDSTFKLSEHINFVAIKNGEHQSKGFVFIDSRLEGAKFKDGDHVARLYDTVMSQFLIEIFIRLPNNEFAKRYLNLVWMFVNSNLRQTY